jgi:sortase (surface protein transpeptidase)
MTTTIFDSEANEKESEADSNNMIDPTTGEMYYLDVYEPLIPGLRLRAANVLTKVSKWILIAGVILLGIAYIPSLWYATDPSRIANISTLLGSTAREAQEAAVAKHKVEPKIIYQPSLNPALPMESSIKIASVGISTGVNEAMNENYEQALRVGVWRVPEFGTPYDRELPTILAAHRFGYLNWSVPYRLKNSFYNLPKVKVGDTVEINWKQRKYVYEVYGEENGNEITDYSADLVLYTCESLNSSTRIIKYAKLLEI